MDGNGWQWLTLYKNSNHQEKADQPLEPEPMEIDQARYIQPKHSDKLNNLISGMRLNQQAMAWWRWVKIWQSLRSITWNKSTSSLFHHLHKFCYRSIVPSVVRMLQRRTSCQCTSKLYTITANPFCVTNHVISLLQQSITLLLTSREGLVWRIARLSANSVVTSSELWLLLRSITREEGVRKNISALNVRISLISPKVLISRFTKRSLTPKVTLDRVKVTSQCIPLWSNMCAKLIITYRWTLSNSITSHLIMSALKSWSCQDEIYFAAISVYSLP